MTQTTARILQGLSVLADDVIAEVEVHREPGGFLSWGGVFQLEQTIPMLLNGTGPFEVRFGDGRSGQFLVTRVELASIPMVVTFQGSGPLK